jgi:5-methylcytosine-specific restriction endonuclease McrA
MKYKVEDLIKYINQDKSTDEIGVIYGVSGRTIRNWFKKEGLTSNVKYKGCNNITSGEYRDKAIKNSKETIKNKDKKIIECECEICNSIYTVKESVYNTVGSRFCSNECKYIFLFNTEPENHPRWKGGITNKNQNLRNSLEYREWRSNVYKKDFYKCQKCNSIGKDLNAHHIENWSGNPDLRFDINNGITLCGSCHNELHEQYGYKTNRENLNEFLNIKTNSGWKRSSLETF